MEIIFTKNTPDQIKRYNVWARKNNEMEMPTNEEQAIQFIFPCVELSKEDGTIWYLCEGSVWHEVPESNIITLYFDDYKFQFKVVE